MERIAYFMGIWLLLGGGGFLLGIGAGGNKWLLGVGVVLVFVGFRFTAWVNKRVTAESTRRMREGWL